MDAYRAVALAEGFEEGPEEEQIEAWQFLVDTGVVWQLQGRFGRTAIDLIQAGVIAAPAARDNVVGHVTKVKKVKKGA